MTAIPNLIRKTNIMAIVDACTDYCQIIQINNQNYFIYHESGKWKDNVA